MIARPVHFTGVWRWLLSVLVMLLLVGHACELPAYAELIALDVAVPHEPTPAPHDDGDDHALTCDATLVIPAHNTYDVSPSLTAAVAAPSVSTLPPTRPLLPARAAKVANGPPLYLRLSALLI